jgi:hypothetical protein
MNQTYLDYSGPKEIIFGQFGMIPPFIQDPKFLAP